AEAQHHADLVRQYPIEAAHHPQHDDRDQHDRDAGAGTEAAGEDAPEAVLAAPQHLLEIGRHRASRAAPAAIAPSAAPGTAATACPSLPYLRQREPRAVAGRSQWPSPKTRYATR